MHANFGNCLDVLMHARALLVWHGLQRGVLGELHDALTQEYATRRAVLIERAKVGGRVGGGGGSAASSACIDYLVSFAAKGLHASTLGIVL